MATNRTPLTDTLYVPTRWEKLIDEGELELADEWLQRAERELGLMEQQLNNGREITPLVLEYRNRFSLLRAVLLQTSGKVAEAAAAYASVNKSSLMEEPASLEVSVRYLMAARRYDEAITFMNRIDTLSPASEHPRMTLDIIFERMVPRYEAQLWGGDKSEALETATEIFHTIDSVRVAQKHNDAAELAVIYEMNQKDRTLEQKEAAERFHLIVISGLLLVLTIGGIALWRVMVAKQKLHEKNLQLYDAVRQMMDRDQQTDLQLQACSQEELTVVQKLYIRICQMMDNEKPFTNAELGREELAQMLGTNYNYVADAIRGCSDGMTINDFLNHYRLSYAAKLLTTTDDAVTVIADLAGFNNRSYFNRLFRERYKLTPTEYRKVSKEEVSQ